MYNDQKVLSEPFDIETHKKTFIDYLEVIILQDGTVVYAIPSHQEKLIALACEKLQITRDVLNALCPVEYYGDFMNWLCKLTDCVSVWNRYMVGNPNERQQEVLKCLRDAGIYKGNVLA